MAEPNMSNSMGLFRERLEQSNADPMTVPSVPPNHELPLPGLGIRTPLWSTTNVFNPEAAPPDHTVYSAEYVRANTVGNYSDHQLHAVSAAVPAALPATVPTVPHGS